ncbi:hypothetical protein BGZ81_011364 [Podila clonocystis]|nr:hypothetical protein BGZ81_011364 [Podila clonocystis]
MSGHDIIPTPSSSGASSTPAFGTAHNPVVQGQNNSVVFDARALHNLPQVRIGGFRGEIPAQLNFDDVPAGGQGGQEERVPTHGHAGDVEEPQGGEGSGEGSGGDGGNGRDGQAQGEAPRPTNIRDMLRLGLVEMPDMTGPRHGRITLPVEKPHYY